MPEFSGEVISNNIVSLRFPESGQLDWLKCQPGQIVRIGDALAALDPKPIQIALDIELADFRRIRAEFDQLTRQIPTPKTEDDKTKKEIAQSKLDVSVKSVEKYKIQLDGLTLISPADAVVLSSASLMKGVNITPGSYPIILAPLDSFFFEAIIPEEDFYQISPAQKGRVSLKNGQSFDSEVVFLSPKKEDNDHFAAHFRLPPLNLTNFRLGTSGKVNF